MKHGIVILFTLLAATAIQAAEFRHIGDFAVRSRIKIVEDHAFPTTIKPLRLSAFTDGITVRISTTGDPENASEYTIYRSDGIGRQQGRNGALEVIPGVQASSDKGGVLRQLRLTERTLTLTSFPGVSNQVVVTHAVVIAPPRAVPADPPPTADR
ncbi:hypothetical protein [Haloferula sp. A504]|uniref:hypothetical protein n=1 Tax=Haloferula sp. A504 TaxID=3373601 RepID=UPI0031BCB0E9|nr:hypothetical protein [Verrucomicrobiaceae bacterium E54]